MDSVSGNHPAGRSSKFVRQPSPLQQEYVLASVSSIGLSLIICCYNSAARLPKTLRHIAGQHVPKNVLWEVIVVDNASTDDTGAVARSVWGQTGCTVPFKIVHQPVPGLLAAREKGLEHSRYDFLLFCDDDNWLQHDYVRQAYAIMLLHPTVAVLGGRGQAVSDQSLPWWFENNSRYYAVGSQASCSGDVTNAKGYVYGAGFVVRRSAWMQLRQLGFKSQLTGRKGNALSSGEDMEICYALRLLGWRIWYDDRLAFKHYLSANRLDWKYFLKLVQDGHRCIPYIDAYLRILNGNAKIRSLRWHWLRECYAILILLLKRPVLLKTAVLNREVSQRVMEWRQLCGEWGGWWSVRHAYAEIYHSIQTVQASASQANRAGALPSTR